MGYGYLTDLCRREKRLGMAKVSAFADAVPLVFTKSPPNQCNVKNMCASRIDFGKTKGVIESKHACRDVAEISNELYEH